MRKVIQFLIIGAVVVSNAQWHWTPNGYLASWIGIALAFVVTVAVTRLTDALRAMGWLASPTSPFST